MSYLNPFENPTLMTDLDTMHGLVEALQAHDLQGESIYETPEFPAHRALAAHVGSAREKILASYQWNVPLLTQHVAGPEADDRATALLVHASTPRTVREMNLMTTEPEELGARVAAVQDLLIKLGTVEIGQPFSYRLGNNRHESYRIEGETIQRPQMLHVNHWDQLTVTTPFVQPGLDRMYADGQVSFHRLATRVAGDLATFTLSIGDEALRKNIQNAIDTSREHNGEFRYLQDMLKNTHSARIAECVSAEDFAWLEEQVARTYAGEPRTVLESTFSLEALYNLGGSGDGLEARVARTKELVLEYIGELTADETNLHTFSFICQEASRKLLILDKLLAVRGPEELQRIEHLIREDDDMALIQAYKQVVARTL